MVVKAGLAETLSGEGPFTVIAPTNEAFAKLPKDLVDTLMGDVELLKKVLLHHVVDVGAVTSDMIQNDMAVNSVVGTQHRVNIYLKSKFYPVSKYLVFCYTLAILEFVAYARVLREHIYYLTSLQKKSRVVHMSCYRA